MKIAKKKNNLWDWFLYIIASVGIIAAVIGIGLLLYKILTGT